MTVYCQIFKDDNMKRSDEKRLNGKMIDISLIIVNWNTRNLLLDCLESIYKETIKVTFEIILVDNGSTDDSVIAVKDRFPDVLVIENRENIGYAKANNQGLKCAKGRYCAIVNTDIIILDKAIEKLVEYFDSDENVGAAGPLTVNEFGNIKENFRYFPRFWNQFVETFFLDKIFGRFEFFHGRNVPKKYYEQTRKVENLSGCFFMIRREALEEVGLLDERFFIYGEDIDWSKRIWKTGWEIHFYPEARVIHLGGKSSIASPVRFQLEMEKSYFQYIKKHSSFPTYILYKLMRIVQHCIFLILAPLIFSIALNWTKNNRLKYKGRLSKLIYLWSNW